MNESKKKIEVTPEITRQIATRRAMGIPLRDLEKEFGFSRPVIGRILASEMGRAIQKEIVDSAITGAVMIIKRELSEMNQLALRALRLNLEKANMEAVKTYFKALGLETVEKDQGNQQQVIQVVLPGQSAPKEIKDVDHE